MKIPFGQNAARKSNKNKRKQTATIVSRRLSELATRKVRMGCRFARIRPYKSTLAEVFKAPLA